MEQFLPGARFWVIKSRAKPVKKLLKWRRVDGYFCGGLATDEILVILIVTGRNCGTLRPI
jgi:hypothetical protein